MSTEKNKTVVKSKGEELWSKANLPVLGELMAADLCNHYPPPGTAPDLEGFKQIITMHRTAFAGFRVTSNDFLSEGDRVAIRWTWSGTHEGEYMGIAPTGNQVTLKGISIHRFEGGKIVEQWHEMDMLGLMQQLGVVPSPG